MTFGQNVSPAVAQFFRTCATIGSRRADRRGDYWTREEWEVWVKRGRAAFGNSRTALFGQLFLVEVLLENGCSGEQIADELRGRKAQVEAQDALSAKRAAETERRAKKARDEADIEEAVHKEMVRLEARKRAESRAEEAGIARPGRARRTLVGIGGGE